MRKWGWVGAAVLLAFGAGAAFSDAPNGSSPITITLIGDEASRLLENDYRRYSGPANVSCESGDGGQADVCVIQLAGDRTN